VNRLLWTVLIILLATNAFGLRASKPIALKYPITEEQITQLNDFLQDIWYMQNGRAELDVVTSPKTNANNGEVWMIMTGGNVRLQFKANNQVYTTDLQD